MPGNKKIHTDRMKVSPPAGSKKHGTPKGERGVIFCSECGAAYFMKSWRHALEEYKSTPEDTVVKFALCPACEMVKSHRFEGEVSIENIPEKKSGELVRMIERFGSDARERDVLHRITGMKREGAKLVVTTTENQLANKLANKIKETFHNVELARSFSSGSGDAVYITIKFVG